MKTRFLVLFFLIYIFSFVVRSYQLTQNPQGFDQTEAGFGYNAYSVMRTGRDEDGKFLPLVLVTVGDYKLTGYMYWQVPFIAVFGLNEFSTRLSTAVAGMISLLLVYFIVNDLSKNRKIALLTVFFTSISPWHVILSRMAYDPMIALMFLLGSVAFFIQWYKTGRLYHLLGCALALSWAILTYYAVWVILPFIMVFYVICIYKKTGKTKKLLYAIALMLLPLLMIAKLVSMSQGQRLGQDSTFQVAAYPLLQEQIREDQHQFPLLVTRAFHNKLIFYPQFLLQNLYNNLSFDFLFLRGDKMDRRFSIPYQGVLYLWSAPFLLLGILYFWKNHSFYKNFLILGSIFVIFLGSSFSEFGSETERTLFATPLFSFLISYGLITIFNKMRKFHTHISTIVLVGIGILLSLNITYFNHQYYWHANVHEPWGRDFGTPEMISSVQSLESNYKNVVVPDSTYMFFYFYNKVDPSIAWAESTNRLSEKNYLGLNSRARIGNYLTMPIECPSEGKLNVLYVCRGTKIPKNSKIVNIIRYRDEQPAFVLLEFSVNETMAEPPKNVQFMMSSGIINDESDRYW